MTGRASDKPGAERPGWVGVLPYWLTALVLGVMLFCLCFCCAFAISRGPMIRLMCRVSPDACNGYCRNDPAHCPLLTPAAPAIPVPATPALPRPLPTLPAGPR